MGLESATSEAGSGAGLPAGIVAYDAYCASYLDPFVAACDKLGGEAAQAGAIVKEAWQEQRVFLMLASQCKEPAQTKLPSLLASLGAQLKASGALVRRNDWEKHTKTCSEGIQCLNWLCVKPAPRDFIESYIGGSDYWANGIRKEHRTTNPDQVAFCDTFKKLLQELMIYVKDHHMTGVTWNPKGGDVESYSASAPAATAPAPAPAAKVAATTAAPMAAKADLFAALNKDSAITSGLKKVSKDQQTWRTEFKGGDAPPVPKAAPKAPATAAPVMKYPPKCVFEGSSSRWLVEYQIDQGVVQIDITDKKETVYIFGCVGASINITGKCKSIVVDGCKKTTVTFSAAMASCEVVNCQRVYINCTETVASVAIDKTDGIVVTLPRSSLDTEVVASKSSEMNLSWPDESGDMVERPIPEQYVHKIKGMSVTADVSDLYR
ncbi:adenylate cyclase associated N terminal-domain-containing protein [Ochromonadaceae sp. CCMP2298]|nr:adenylate cyclase associated N terminal-domain-containing protein [Ochromonadaceae sp. CCMP2298]